jgi:hypothetical protein
MINYDKKIGTIDFTELISLLDCYIVVLSFGNATLVHHNSTGDSA